MRILLLVAAAAAAVVASTALSVAAASTAHAASEAAAAAAAAAASTVHAAAPPLAAVRIAPPPAIVAAFINDGFAVDAALSYGAGVGVSATSTTATINGNTSLRKPAYYVAGSAFEMGFLIGALAEPRVEAMTSTFIEHIVPGLINEALDNWLQNSTLAPAYDALCAALAALLEFDAIKYFNASIAAGAIPPELVDELRGMAAGAASVAPGTTATYERLVTLQMGYDMLLGLIYTGEILDLLLARAEAAGASASVLAILRTLPAAALRPPVLCNAFAARGAQVAGGAGSIFGRDFMFALGEVFQLHVSTTIYVPSDGRAPLVALAAPGFVGAMVAMNAHGVAMGVDVLQAALGNTSVIGLNSLLMVRAAMHAATDSASAIAYVTSAQRGVPWIYPLSDASGNGAVLETVPTPGSDAGGTPPDWRPLVEDAALRALLPSPAQIAAALTAPVEYDRGVFIRRIGVHARPEAALIPAFNPALFAAARIAYPPPSSWAPGGSVWANYTEESAAYSAGLAQRYFSPERSADDNLVFATNLALSPHLRIAAMTTWTSLDGMGSPQWRYDQLVREVLAAAPLTVASAQFAMQFQQRTPGYEGATVDGVMSVSDLAARVLTAKGGYWVDAWTTVTLPAYL